MKIKRTNKLGLVSKVTATIKDGNGNIVRVQVGKNTIAEGDPNSVENGLVFLLERLFAVGSYYAPSDYLAKMQLGQGTPSNSGLGNPLTGVPGTTMIDFASAALDEVGGSWYDDPKMVVSCTWGASFNALSNVIEAGLFNNASTPELFAYKTFSPALSKTSEGEIELTWEIQVAYT